MSHRALLLLSLGLGSSCGAMGCTSSNVPPDGSGGRDRDGAQASCDIDYASYATGAPVSFRADVMPIFGFACTDSGCHNSHDQNAKLNLGTRCRYDPATTGCIYPDAIDPKSTQAVPPAPLTQEVIDAAYASLMMPSVTVQPPTVVSRVVKGDPENSFLIQKTAGTEGEHGYTCKSYDTSNATTEDPCGDFMPLGGAAPLCSTSRAEFDALARWISQGAPNE